MKQSFDSNDLTREIMIDPREFCTPISGSNRYQTYASNQIHPYRRPVIYLITHQSISRQPFHNSLDSSVVDF